LVFEQDKRVKALTKEELQTTMSNLEPPIKFIQADKTEALIKNIIASMRTRHVAPSSEQMKSQEAGRKRVHEADPDDDDAQHDQKGRKIDGGIPGEDLASIKHDSDVALTVAPPMEHPASAGTGTFCSQHLAGVLNAAFSSREAMIRFVDGVKGKSDAFKDLTKSKRIDNKSISFSKMQMAESIAKCRPDGVSNAEELLCWLVKVSSSESSAQPCSECKN
jgi:hypothetical protein